MKRDRVGTDEESDERAIHPTDAFGVLSERERQYAVHYLAENDVASLGELAESIARHGDVPDDAERIAVALHHSHLPKLATVGLVEYDPATRTVESRPDLTAVTPYLPASALRGTE